ncbi:MAG: Gfo/Idh/MocA family oxidoreductase, partial [Planctomycetes bacterium]|nr:Gfo/Idh/MocA family oxidoreductase [Planctomycetota bacterium]
MADEVRIGIIGTGQIGKAHVKKWQEVPGVRIVAVCDADEAEARRVAAEYRVPQVFKNFRDLLALKDVAAVDVCLHNNLHAPVSTAAMDAGKHVYVEKPLAGSYADARRMVEAADKTGRMLHMQLSTLYSMETRAARRFVDDGHLGRVYYAKSSGYRRRGRPYVDGYGTSSFVQKSVASGGALYDMGVYHIGQILYLLDNPPVRTVSGDT